MKKKSNFIPCLLLFSSLILSYHGCKTIEENVTTSEKSTTDNVTITNEEEQKNAILQIEKTPVEIYDKGILETYKEEKKAEGPYTLKIGDKIEISVLDEPEMTREVFVLPDGSFNYLLVGKIMAEGKTPEELSSIVSEKLSKYLRDPEVSVLVKDLSPSTQTTNFVSIVGAVQKPGKIEIKEGDRLIDAITNAGGLLFINDIWGGRAVANLNAAYISRDGEKLNVNLDKLLREGDMTQNILLKPGDFIYFPESDTSNVIVLGEVRNPNIIPFTRNISLIEALSRCGGFTEKAQKGTVIVLRMDGNDTIMKKVDIEAILYGKEKASSLSLKGGDIVFVPEQGLSEYERYAGYLMTFADLILRAYQVREQIRFPRLHRRDSHYY